MIQFLSSLIACFACALCLQATLYAGKSPESKDLGAIWFIGDSITQSNGDRDPNGSPRKALYDLLVAHGYSFSYTGHFTENADGLPATGDTPVDNLYHYHSGISGSVIGDNIGGRAGMTERPSTHWSSGRLAVVKPDLILIMLGANDVYLAHDLPGAPDRLKALVQRIYELPGAGAPTVFLAQITPNHINETMKTNVIAFNAALPGVVADLVAQGRDVRMVNQFTPINNDFATKMSPDRIHPSAAGNAIIAQQWFNAITPSPSASSNDTSNISHGPMLGAVSEYAARIWVRTTVPAEVTCALSEVDAKSGQLTQKVRTTLASDKTCIITFDTLKKETEYQYVVRVGKSERVGSFTTLGPSLSQKGIRIVYGYSYNHSENKMKPGTSVFTEMASRKADLILFLGDFPYTARGGREEVRKGSRKLREVAGFAQLTASTPTYGIYDDHDFGPNDCDGTHPNADEALAAFKEYWPNPSYGLPEDKGIYCSFVVGNVEFFLLDGRYPARKKQKTMLGKVQFKWLCDGLKNSKSRYKVLVSGTQFGRAKADGWAGEFYLGERKKLFSFISDHDISGVIGISGDVHRSDIYKLPIGKDRNFYDFTPGALSRTQRIPPNPLPETMIHSHGDETDNNMYGEIEFRPASDTNAAIIFRSLSAKNGLVYEHKLTPDDLALTK